MSDSLRRITLADLQLVTRLMNDSSQGYSQQFRLSPLEFLFLSNFWQFSYPHSYLGFVDSQPAGIVLNCVDTEGGEAYCFYWGVLAEFRGRPLSLRLVRHCREQFRKEGFHWVHVQSTLSTPTVIHIRLGFKPAMELVTFETDQPKLDQAPALPVAPLQIDEILPDPTRLQQPVHWTRRPYFVRQARQYLRAVGCRRKDGLAGYAVLTSDKSGTSAIDLQCTDKPTGAAIVRALVIGKNPPPYSFSYVPTGSMAYDVLTDMGFQITQRIPYNMLDLRT